MPEATPTESKPPSTASSSGYAPTLGLFSATMMVVGGIIGSGIFLNPAIVAARVGTTGADAVGLGPGWCGRPYRSTGLCGARSLAAGSRRRIRLPARRVWSASRLSLRLDSAAGDRHGGNRGSGRDLCQLRGGFAGLECRSESTAGRGGHHYAVGSELRRSQAWRPHAERAHRAQARGAWCC